MTLAATFLGGAKSRLLPPSVPFRFFASAIVFHILMWLALLLGAPEATSFRGGLGPALSAVHLLTLGVLTTTAIGASVQLLPVATRRPLAAVWPIKLVFWLTVPGTLALAASMFVPNAVILIAAGAVTTLGLLLFAGILADNLRRAASLPVVAAYGWAALASLVLLVVLGLALALDYQFALLVDHAGAALTHLIVGGFGFMGLLAIGFSHVLVPMFALASAPPARLSWTGFAIATAAVALGSAGALADSRLVLTLALLIGLAAAALHLGLMHGVLQSGMRKRLGLSFLLIRAAWMMLPATLLVGLAALYDLAGPNGPSLFGFMLLGGWLLTFLLGILQRILPFLASMHTARSAGASAPVTSELANSSPLKLQALCHGLALTLIALSIAADVPILLQTGSAIGLAGAVSFAWFAANILRRVFAAT
jgi:hypothetical protein